MTYMTPVFLLSDGYLANGAEPWLIPARRGSARHPRCSFRTDPKGYFPYLRDPTTLARPWAIPGTPGLEHRIGGLEKEYLTGNVSYAPANHEQMVRVRARKIAGIVREIPPTEVIGPPRATCWWSAGAAPTARSSRRTRALRERRARGVARAPALSEPAAGRPRATSCAASSRCSCRR